MDQDTINWVIFHIHVDKNKEKFLAVPSSAKLEWERGIGEKKLVS